MLAVRAAPHSAYGPPGARLQRGASGNQALAHPCDTNRRDVTRLSWGVLHLDGRQLSAGWRGITVSSTAAA